ncbi:MAG: hypothetical protein GF401_02980 [Chitinivibrionales bacterium]|nr:hypothetical protein [Chitinivibrionales bacterium]
MKRMAVSLVGCILLLTVSCGVGQGMTAKECFEQGKEELSQGNQEKAYKYFLAATKKEPRKPEYEWAAAQVTSNQNAAFLHTKAAWEKGLKHRAILHALARLSFHTQKSQKLDYVLSLYQELDDTSKSDAFKASLYYQFEAYDSALTLWTRAFQKKPTSSLCNRIAVVLNKSGNADSAMAFLASCRKKKLLNPATAVMLASFYAFDYKYDSIEDLFQEAQNLGNYTDPLQLEHAGFLIAQERRKEAEELLKGISKAAAHKHDHIINLRARTSLGLLYLADENIGAIKDLAANIPGKSPYHEGEKLFYQALLSIAAENSGRLALITSAREKLPRDPAVELVYARENVVAQQYEVALDAYRKLPQVFLRSPRVLVEYATALSLAGKSDEALAVVSTMHRKNVMTKYSLTLFRDLAFRKKLLDKSRAAQRILESKYGDDVKVIYSGALMALKSGKVDSARALFTQLAADHPDEPRFEAARLSTWVIKEEYEKAARECEKSSAPPEVVAPIQAQAYLKLGEIDKAEQTYERALGKDKNPGLVINYANFLLTAQKTEKAARMFRTVLDSHKEDLAKDSAANAALLNNFAWSLAHSPDFDKKTAISAAEQARNLAPDNLHILDTYATVLLESDEHKSCIKLLENHSATQKEPALLISLAQAYAGNKKINKAVRAYQDALRVPDSARVALKPSLTKRDIKENIDALIGGEE